MSLIEQLSEDFPLSDRDLRRLIATAPLRYKVHMIEKRNGRGQREIAQPTSEIKTLQRWAIENYLSNLPVHRAASAYQSGKSIKDHAQAHAKNSYLLKLDFKDFFPSIRGIDFKKHINQYAPHLNEEVELLVRLLFWVGKPQGELRLSIGAPSSPAISNTIMFPFDQALDCFCAELDAKYTRYADDIAISTNQPHSLDKAFEFITSICRTMEYPRLVLNEKKTVFTSKKHNRRLTGLVLTNDGKVSLGRDKKRLIRSMAHHYLTRRLNDEEINKLRGLIAFAVSIEPHFIEAISRMMGSEAFANLTKGYKSID